MRRGTERVSSLPQVKSLEPDVIWSVGNLGEIEYSFESICWIISIVKNINKKNQPTNESKKTHFFHCE